MELSEIRKCIIGDFKQLKDKRGFLKANTTNYERLFGRDSLIVSWQLLKWNPNISRATLEILSRMQGKSLNSEREEEPGKILHETDFEKGCHSEGYFPFPYYGSVDSTPLFLIIFSYYFRQTKDRKFLDSHWKNILQALQWLEEYGDKDKDFFLEYERKNPKGLFHQGWKDSFNNHLKADPPVAIVEAQGYQYEALNETAYLAEIKRDFKLAERLKFRAAALKKEFNEKFWILKENYFALALDGEKKQKRTIVSNPGLLLFTDIIEKEKVNLVVERIFKEDLWTPYGIRTHSSLEADFDPFSYHLGTVWPHDNWIIAQGLKKLEKKEEFTKIKEAILLAHKKIKYRYFPEYYAVSKNNLYWSEGAGNPQAWTIGALFDFLGITPSLKERIFQSASFFLNL